MNIFYIYAHINPINKEVFYIGKGKNNRAYSTNRRSTRWFNYISKYGYKVKILESNLEEHEAFQREIYHIKNIGRKDNGLGTLINMSDGGSGGNNNKGRTLSEEWKRKIGDASRGRKMPFRAKTEAEKLKISNSMKGQSNYWLKGKKQTQEHIEKVASKNRGRKMSEAQKELSRQRLLRNPIMISDEQRRINNKIHSERMKGDGNPRYGIKCSNELRAKLSLSHIDGGNRAINMMDINGELLKEFKSIKVALIFLGKKSGNTLINCLKKRTISAYGYTWAYKEDSGFPMPRLND